MTQWLDSACTTNDRVESRRADSETEDVAPDLATLQQRAKEGRIVSTDYVWNPILQRWMLAREAVELNGYIGQVRGVSRRRRGCGGSLLLLLAGLQLPFCSIRC